MLAYECLKCCRRSTSRYVLASHIKRRHKVWGDTSQHRKRVPKGDNVPAKCGYVKPSKPLKMVRHVKVVPENISYYKCEHCGFAYETYNLCIF